MRKKRKIIEWPLQSTLFFKLFKFNL